MNGLEGFIIGWICGIVTTFVGIMLFTKYMNKADKEAAIKRGKEKWEKKS